MQNHKARRPRALPPELWIMILERCQLPEMWRARSVSRRIYALSRRVFRLRLMKPWTLAAPQPASGAASASSAAPRALSDSSGGEKAASAVPDSLTILLVAKCFPTSVSYNLCVRRAKTTGRVRLSATDGGMTKPSVGFKGFGAMFLSVFENLRHDPLHVLIADQARDEGDDDEDDEDNEHHNANADAGAQSSGSGGGSGGPIVYSGDSSDSQLSTSQPGSLPTPAAMRERMEQRRADFRAVSEFLKHGWASMGTLIPAGLMPAYDTLFRHVFATFASIFERPSLTADIELQVALLSQTWRVVDVLAPPSGRDLRLCRDTLCCGSQLVASLMCPLWRATHRGSGERAENPREPGVSGTQDDANAATPDLGGPTPEASPLSEDPDAERVSVGTGASDSTAAPSPSVGQPASTGNPTDDPDRVAVVCNVAFGKAGGIVQRSLYRGAYGPLSVIRYIHPLMFDSTLTLVCLSHSDLEEHLSVVDVYLRLLGVRAPLRFCDVYGLDEGLLMMIPRPVKAVVLLFPYTDKYQDFKRDEQARIAADGQTLSPNVFFVRQTIRNACGTIGLMHAFGNNESALDLANGPLKRILDRARERSPEERASVLEADEDLAAIHKQSSLEGQTAAPDAEDESLLHFICFVAVDGHVYELDGNKPFPINHGPSSDDLMLDVVPIIRKFMEREPDSVDFTVVALAAAGDDRE
ncbi:ubiquitinyl hydrolase 1 [Polyrhizophydium stewartii]|uniref:Ubiquitin carboxyl-terminal hydrolase n=1 Tax=Polyrhizophydium stewartii TaxID=2732419 RepID=A0ABR4ND02_9FUNG